MGLDSNQTRAGVKLFRESWAGGSLRQQFVTHSPNGQITKGTSNVLETLFVPKELSVPEALIVIMGR